MTFLVLPFAACVIGAYALEDIVYNEVIPGALAGAIPALYLAATFAVGLTTPLRAASLGPVVGFAAVTLLWPLTPWESYDDLTYDSGWAGAVIYTLLQSFIIWLVAQFGWNLAAPKKQ